MSSAVPRAGGSGWLPPTTRGLSRFGMILLAGDGTSGIPRCARSGRPSLRSAEDADALGYRGCYGGHLPDGAKGRGSATAPTWPDQEAQAGPADRTSAPRPACAPRPGSTRGPAAQGHLDRDAAGGGSAPGRPAARPVRGRTPPLPGRGSARWQCRALRGIAAAAGSVCSLDQRPVAPMAPTWSAIGGTTGGPARARWRTAGSA